MSTFSKNTAPVKYEVKFKDIDPDTGLVSQNVLMAVCPDLNKAHCIAEALTKDWFESCGDPNREFFVETIY
jgi:hypothetical protein